MFVQHPQGFYDPVRSTYVEQSETDASVTYMALLEELSPDAEETWFWEKVSKHEPIRLAETLDGGWSEPEDILRETKTLLLGDGESWFWELELDEPGLCTLVFAMRLRSAPPIPWAECLGCLRDQGITRVQSSLKHETSYKALTKRADSLDIQIVADWYDPKEGPYHEIMFSI